MPQLLVLGPRMATWWLLPDLRSVPRGLLVPLLLGGLLPWLGTQRIAMALLLPSCCCLGVLLLAGKLGTGKRLEHWGFHAWWCFPQLGHLAVMASFAF